MRFFLILMSFLTVYALEVRYLYRHLGRLLDSKSYYKRLIGVFAVTVLFVLTMFGIPSVVIVLTGGLARVPGTPPRISETEFLRGLPEGAIQLGLAAVVIRLAYDASLVVLRVIEQRRARE